MNQKLFFGYGKYNKLDYILKKHSAGKIFMVTGKKSFTLSGAEKLIGEIVNKYEYVRFYNFEVNPKIEDIKRGLDLFNNSKCDFIIGVGGGSVMDMAKSISILATKKGNIKEIIKNGNYLECRKSH